MGNAVLTSCESLAQNNLNIVLKFPTSIRPSDLRWSKGTSDAIAVGYGHL